MHPVQKPSLAELGKKPSVSESNITAAYLDAVDTAEMAAVDDRHAALALSRGEQLPPRTGMQAMLGDPTFKIPELPLYVFTSRKGWFLTSGRRTLLAYQNTKVLYPGCPFPPFVRL